MKPCLFKAGDWVRFYRNGVLVIGVVEYVRRKPGIASHELLTDAGTVMEHDVVEARLSEPEAALNDSRISFHHERYHALPYHFRYRDEETICETLEEVHAYLQTVQGVEFMPCLEVGHRGTFSLEEQGDDMATEFNYKRAHREWAYPEWEALPDEVKELYLTVIEKYDGTNQSGDLSMPWLEGIEELFDVIDMEVLAHSAMVINALGHWDSSDNHDLEFPRNKHGAHWKYERLARQNLVKRGYPGPMPKPPSDQYMDHKEGTDYNNEELTELLRPMIAKHFSVLRVDNVNHRIRNAPFVKGHPFVIGRKHLENSNTMILDPRCAPCSHCGYSYDHHISDRVALLIPIREMEGDTVDLNEEEAETLRSLDEFFKENKIDGVAFVAKS